jgi:hypothetical protein
MNLSVGSGDRSGADVCIWLRTPFGWKTWVRIGKLRERSTRVNTVDDEDIRSSELVQASDGLYAEVPLWCASGPIARRWIARRVFRSFLTARMGVSVGRLPQEVLLEESYRNGCSGTIQVYVCSKSFRLCLTVVHWLLECNEVPSWIENPEYVTIFLEWMAYKIKNHAWLPFRYLPVYYDGYVWTVSSLWNAYTLLPWVALTICHLINWSSLYLFMNAYMLLFCAFNHHPITAALSNITS